MWAERPQTAAQLRAGAGELSQALALAQLQPGDIVIREGTPPQAAPAKAAADEINWSVLVPAAASIGSHAGLRAGVAVLDTVTGAAYSAGDTGLFGTASVVKVMIAAYLLSRTLVPACSALRSCIMASML